MRDSSSTVQLHPKFPNATADSRDVDLLAIKTFQMQSVFTNCMYIYFSYKPAANRLLVFFSLSFFSNTFLKVESKNTMSIGKVSIPPEVVFGVQTAPG